MTTKRNEISYYPEIRSYIEAQIKSNFLVKKKASINVYWGIGELKAKLQEIIALHPAECNCVKSFASRVPPLNLDIFALITDGFQFRLLILEVKLLSRAGLKEWSQLVGYCLVSGAKYGLLINIDNGASQRLFDILTDEPNLSCIETINNKHLLGFMQWDSLTHDFVYSNLGFIKSVSDLSNQLIMEFH